MKKAFKKPAWLTLLVGLALVFATPVASIAQETTTKTHETKTKPHKNKLQIPDLTEEQKVQIKSLRLEQKQQTLPLKNELREKQARLQTLMTADQADMNSINALIDDMSTLKASMTKAKAATRQDIRKVLTDEQRIVFDTHASEKRQRKGHHKKH